MKIFKASLLILWSSLLISCSNNQEVLVEAQKVEEQIKHNYHSIGKEIDETSMIYKIHSVKTNDNIPADEGSKWISVDMTLKDVDGMDYSIYDYSILYADFVLIDSEENIYYSYNKGNKVPFNQSVRDVTLFNVPNSENNFLLFYNSSFESYSDLDLFTRDITRIKLQD